MSTRTKVIIVTVIAAVASFMLGPVLWPMVDSGPAPEGLQLPLLILIGALESVAFGLGLSFLLFGWPVVQCIAAPSKGAAMALYASIGWQLVSWWPHDRMHMSNGDNLWRLIRIEYIFHFTLIVSAIVMAACFFDILKHHPKAEKDLGM